MICNHVAVAVTTDSTLTIMPTGVITTVNEATTVTETTVTEPMVSTTVNESRITTTVNNPRITTTANGAKKATTVSKVRSSTMIMILATNNPNDTDILNDKDDAFDFLQDVCVHICNILVCM